MSVYFHANFGLNRHRMAGVLQCALRYPEMTDADLASPFGYKAPFAARYRSWLHKTGLIEQGRPVRLTTYGSVVWKNDPSLSVPATHWLMHWELTTDPTRAEVWHFFINDFLRDRQEFSRDDLLMSLTEKLRTHSEEHFGPGSRLNLIITNKLINCYSREYGLGELGIISVSGNLLKKGYPENVQGPWSSPEEFSWVY